MNQYLLIFILFVALALFGTFIWYNFHLITKFVTGGMEDMFEGGARRKKISINTQEPWFSEIKSGKKLVEARVGKPDLYKEFIGRQVDVTVPKVEKIKKTIKAVRHYATLEEYVKKEGWKKIAPHVASEAECIKAYLQIKTLAGDTVYSPERIAERGGVVAIEFEP